MGKDNNSPGPLRVPVMKGHVFFTVLMIGLAQSAPNTDLQSNERERAAVANEAKLKDCSVYMPHDKSPFVLPYEPGTERLVWRGREHFARGNGGVGLYAYDFEMPVGTRPWQSERGRLSRSAKSSKTEMLRILRRTS